MSIRTPSSNNNRQTLLDLQRTQERIALNQQRIGSGQRIIRASDDPTGSALILDFGTSIQNNAQFIKQADSALSFLKSSEDVVSSVGDSITRLQELAQQGVTSTNGASGRAALATEVDSILNNLISLGNTKEQGKYLFAGTQTQTQPFAVNPASPPGPPVTYSGDNGIITLDVAASTSVVTNVTGSSVFFGAGGAGSATDLFQAVSDLSTGLKTNNTALIQTAVASLKGISPAMTQVQTDLGGRQASLSDLKDTLSGFNVTLQGLQGNIQDTNYPDTATQFSADQTAQSATLSALAKTNRQSLFDYLG